MLNALCRALRLDWDPGMLHWSAGPKPEDGAWAPHWYDAVNASTGFGPPPGPLPELTSSQQGFLEAALPVYESLWTTRLKA